MTSNTTALDSEVFGRFRNQPVQSYSLRNSAGVHARILPFGAIIQSLMVPDAQGKQENVVLGFAEFDGYLENNPYFGAVVGRFANRIARGRFALNGNTVELPVNDGQNHLHGGPVGFSKRMWTVDPERSLRHEALSLTLTSEDGDQGFPGRLDVRVTYSLSEQSDLVIDYEATTDRPTHLNLSQHSYFHLGGEGSGSAMDHILRLNASAYVEIDEHLNPTGRLAPVAESPLDFRTPKPLDQDLRAGHPQMCMARGYDHNFVIDRPHDEPAGLVEVAHLLHPVSGRSLSIDSTEPGVQLYTGNFLDGSLTGTSGRAYRQGDGIALETQHFPDSPNQPAFPSTRLDPGDRFHSQTVWRFRW